MRPNFNILPLLLLCLYLVTYVRSACEPETPFPPPVLSTQSLQDTFTSVHSSLNESIAQGIFNTTSFSLEISSSQKTLFSLYHASNTPNAEGTTLVDGSSVYRIASNTKVFTALAILQQQSKGALSLDDAVIKYVPDLLQNATSSRIAWETITLRTLMAHLSGIPDNCEWLEWIDCPVKQLTLEPDAEDDLLLTITDPTEYGLPPISSTQAASLPQCEGFSNYTSACTSQGVYFVLIASMLRRC